VLHVDVTGGRLVVTVMVWRWRPAGFVAEPSLRTLSSAAGADGHRSVSHRHARGAATGPVIV